VQRDERRPGVALPQPAIASSVELGAPTEPNDRYISIGKRVNAAQPSLLAGVVFDDKGDWANRLMSGRSKSANEIAAEDGVGSSYVTPAAHLGFLAPDLVMPPTLNTSELLAHVPLPLEWDAQRGVLGFET
jgi:hypothetical protein